MEGFFLDIKQVSSYLNIKPSLTYALVESKEIPHYRVGRLIRFKKEEVDRWIEGHKVAGSDTNHRAKRASRSLGQSRKKVDDIVRESIEDIKGSGYNLPNGKSDRIKGLGKEVEHGSL